VQGSRVSSKGEHETGIDLLTGPHIPYIPFERVKDTLRQADV